MAKITDGDRALRERFVDEPDSYGFGTTQSEARCSNEQIKRLLKLGLIKMCRRNSCVGLKDHHGFVRSTTYYCKA